MLFNCKFCTSPVSPGTEICNRPLCKERELERQSVLQCQVLGIPFDPAPYRSPGLSSLLSGSASATC